VIGARVFFHSRSEQLAALAVRHAGRRSSKAASSSQPRQL
jgi:hypothetical protein